MRQILSKGQVVVCWALALWSSFLLVAWSVDTDNFMGLMFPAIIIAGLALLTLELRKRKPQKGAKPAGRDKVTSRIITFSLLIIAAALTVIAIKTFAGAPPKRSSLRNLSFLEAKVNYIMDNPTDFLDVGIYYDPHGELERGLPESVDTKEKVIVTVRDNRGVFSRKSGKALLGQFKRELESICSSSLTIRLLLDTDIVAKFLNEERIPLGYFYQGEYHL